MPFSRRVPVVALLGSLVAIAAGCGGEGGDSLPREPVSGSITFAGAPLATGTIQFFPLQQGAGNATVAFGMIADGKYAIPREQGLVPGGYKVIVSSSPAGGEPEAGTMPGMSPPPVKDLIPAKYNANTTLNAEIKKDAENVVDFDLKR
jgi:hypothetical protein